MSRADRWVRMTALAFLLPVVSLASCAPAGDAEAGQASAADGTRWSHQDWPTGLYQVADWPQPLPDDDHSHDGWTWGSFGGVYA